MGSMIRRPICTNQCTAGQRLISYARVLIEVDRSKQLKIEIPYVGLGGVAYTQRVVHEWLPQQRQGCRLLEAAVVEQGNAGWVSPRHTIVAKVMPKVRTLATSSRFAVLDGAVAKEQGLQKLKMWKKDLKSMHRESCSDVSCRVEEARCAYDDTCKKIAGACMQELIDLESQQGVALLQLLA
ncbi:hypothetical protein Ancab_025006 [Ancistrocladus abbreviatus]